MIYLSAWVLFCIGAAIYAALYFKKLCLFDRNYSKFLSEPWKLITFLIAVSLFAVVAPYTGDPTWDHIDATFMGVLTFLTAPYSVGIFYRSLKTSQHRISEVLFATCLWLFSASWSYDLYLFWRDGSYPTTWFANLCASSILYALAGLLWNLEWQQNVGARFAFQQNDWPSRISQGWNWKLAWIAVPIMVIVAAIVGAFLI